jgi:flavin-dependent dehydrogenase
VTAPVVIVGGGPGGSVTSLLLTEIGVPSIIVEAGTFPRFHIGEALTGSAGKLLRRLGLGEAMNAQGHAVKTGATVLGRNGRTAFSVPAVDIDPDGVRRPTTTWQVRRSDFDQLLLDAAVERGAQLVRANACAAVRDPAGRVLGVEVERDGQRSVLDSEVLVDASGMACFLHRLGVAGGKERGGYDAQVALFAHLEGTDRNPEGLLGDEMVDNTVLIYTERHHWAWFIPIDDRTVSIGIVVPAKTFRARGESPDDFFRRELRELNPGLWARTERATITRDVEIIANYSYRIRSFAGDGWLCVGDSHRFIDPFFAFGVHLAMFEARLAVEAIPRYLAGEGAHALLEYEQRADAAQDVVQDLVDAFWNEPLAFGYLIDRKHRDDLIDILAGRIYDLGEPSPGLVALRRINAHAAASAG